MSLVVCGLSLPVSRYAYCMHFPTSKCQKAQCLLKNKRIHKQLSNSYIVIKSLFQPHCTNTQKCWNDLLIIVLTVLLFKYRSQYVKPCHRSRGILTRLLFNVLPFWMSRTQTLLKRIRVLWECQEVAWLDDCGLGFIVPLVFCLYSHLHVCRECFRFNTDPCIVYLSLQKITLEAIKMHWEAF